MNAKYIYFNKKKYRVRVIGNKIYASEQFYDVLVPGWSHETVELEQQASSIISMIEAFVPACWFKYDDRTLQDKVTWT